jgi:hypothetical protein
MRLQSKFYDGVPDDVIRKIVEEIVKYFDIILKNSNEEVVNYKILEKEHEACKK